MVILIIVLVIFLITFLLGELAFYRSFSIHKRTEEEAYEYLTRKKLLDKDIYDEVEFEEVEIESFDKLILKGFYVEGKSKNKYIILVHGFKDNHHVQMPFVRMFLKEGFNVLLVDERSHGDSEGKYPTYGYYEKLDLDRWIEYLYNKNDNKDIILGLHGVSMGAATVLICGSNNDKVNFIIEDCGYSDCTEEMLFQIGKAVKGFKIFVYIALKIKAKLRAKINISNIKPIEEIKKTSKPILFIHGDKDTVVPCNMAIDMYNSHNNLNDRLLIVKGAEHICSYAVDRKKYEKEVHAFIQQCIN